MDRILVPRAAVTFFFSLIGFFYLGQILGQSLTVTELSGPLKHREDIEMVKLAGNSYLIQYLSIGELFEGSNGVDDLNSAAVEAERSRLADIIKEGTTPIGAMKVWTFPEFVGAKRYGDGRSDWFSTPVFVPQCVPEFEDPEYARLRIVRSQMFATVARAFPEIPVWLIGAEPEPKFFDCDGAELSLEDHVRFVVDSLEDLSSTVKSVNSSAIIVAHFLGDPWYLLEIDGQRLQPSEILTLIQDEIRSREKPTELYYDQLVHELDPIFLADRFYSPSDEIYFPHLADGMGQSTLISLVNPNPTAVQGQIQFFSSGGEPMVLSVDGSPTSAVPFVIPAGGAVEIETEGGEVLQSGWARVLPDKPIRGASIFRVSGPRGTSLFEAGVGDARATSRASVAVRHEGGLETGIAVANPNDQAVEVNLTLLDSDGAAVAEETVEIPAGGQLARFLGELFSDDLQAGFKGALLIESALPVAPTALRTQDGFQLSSYPVAGHLQ